ADASSVPGERDGARVQGGGAGGSRDAAASARARSTAREPGGCRRNQSGGRRAGARTEGKGRRHGDTRGARPAPRAARGQAPATQAEEVTVLPRLRHVSASESEMDHLVSSYWPSRRKIEALNTLGRALLRAGLCNVAGGDGSSAGAALRPRGGRGGREHQLRE